MPISHLKLKAYGKINLGLDVVRRREDGYHEVRMVMQTVGIYDTIDLVRIPQKTIKVETNLYYLPNDSNNLVYKAAKLLMDEFGIQEGVSIKLQKFIPVAAGMAGGSSDAAAVLFGVNKMFRLGLTMSQLMERGVKIGADVPYCLMRGTALAEGIGEKLTRLPSVPQCQVLIAKPPVNVSTVKIGADVPYCLMRGTALAEGIGEKLTRLPSVPQCQVLIAKPPVNVSTKYVYENLHANDLRAEEHPDIDGMVEAIRSSDLHGIVKRFGNVLERVTLKEYPVIGEIKDKMKKLGAVGTLMSGSGPTVFGLFENPQLAANAYEELRYGEASKLTKQVYLTNFFQVKDEKYIV